ncbi:MAG TPA: hypothetical protein VMT76_04015 [Puia sp.]|nr:hypothetical protein [Puia sp.]
MDSQKQPAALRFLAHLFSVIFHPLFITSYVMYFLLFIHPLAFAGFDNKVKIFRFISVLFSTALLPAFSTFLLWQLKLGVQSIVLRTTKERIIPYALAMIFYWWIWNVYRHLDDSPPVSVHFLLGTFLAVCGAWFCNIYFKISMHAIAVGGGVIFFLLFSLNDGFASGLNLSIVIFIAGIVCTSRFIVSDHTSFELYSGLFIGALAQFLAWQL